VPNPIVKSRVRILRPREYEQLREGAKTLDNRTRLDALLLSGVRYVEAQRLQIHPDWLDGKFVHLPEFAERKVKRRQKERWIRLSSRGVTLLPHFFDKPSLPDWKTWSENLERWAKRGGLDPIGLSAKMSRKTWESWLVASYPERVLEVFLSQGHTETTALQHYLNLPFTESDKNAMFDWTSGWEK